MDSLTLSLRLSAILSVSMNMLCEVITKNFAHPFIFPIMFTVVAKKTFMIDSLGTCSDHPPERPPSLDALSQYSGVYNHLAPRRDRVYQNLNEHPLKDQIPLKLAWFL